jgi:hypothetical protein
MVGGLSKGAGLALLAVPMADAFVYSQAQFQRILSNFLDLEVAISISPLRRQCNARAHATPVNHLQECLPVLGRNSAPHDASTSIHLPGR